ncbi:MAG: helix-turn-helix transcriptional regulator [Nostoc sp. DedQUE08]|uniref:helix-turn-helix domain-containing protein n=1 Tax=Nostoc sp. DedQUE08 TaxID=3075393 RepID=UPI002AD4B3EF|nr:helix-turn-helix transcriptional regulator [Nostoc sp. DedQUE08]MDZ8069158.1 helix-turn-helix transcriptional regulator [Nostoc sp. DedQUE08]
MNNIYCLDTNRLSGLVRSKRGARGLRETSTEIGNVSTATLSRVENGSTPDMETFLALCNWLQVQPAEFFVADQAELELDAEEEIILLLLGDNRLDSNTSYTLAQIVRATYRYLLE